MFSALMFLVLVSVVESRLPPKGRLEVEPSVDASVVSGTIPVVF